MTTGGPPRGNFTLSKSQEINYKPTTVRRLFTFLESCMKTFLIALLSFIALAPSANAIPNCRPCPYSCQDLGLGKKDCSFVSESRGVCCLDLSKKGADLADAQAAVIERQEDRGRPTSSARETCPAGFRPSEQKCSPEERRRGCKDMRLPGGLGCVKR